MDRLLTERFRSHMLIARAEKRGPTKVCFLEGRPAAAGRYAELSIVTLNRRSRPPGFWRLNFIPIILGPTVIAQTSTHIGLKRQSPPKTPAREPAPHYPG